LKKRRVEVGNSGIFVEKENDDDADIAIGPMGHACQVLAYLCRRIWEVSKDLGSVEGFNVVDGDWSCLMETLLWSKIMYTVVIGGRCRRHRRPRRQLCVPTVCVTRVAVVGNGTKRVSPAPVVAFPFARGRVLFDLVKRFPARVVIVDERVVPADDVPVDGRAAQILQQTAQHPDEARGAGQHSHASRAAFPVVREIRVRFEQPVDQRADGVRDFGRVPVRVRPVDDRGRSPP